MVLAFAFGSAAIAAYSTLAAVYPITVIESLWALAAAQRFRKRRRHETESGNQ